MDLKVPYAEKDQAKALGARWDPARRTWYVPSGLDAKLFQRWLAPDDQRLHLRAAEAYLVTAPSRCWRCHAPTMVLGFLLAPGFEDLEVESDDDGREIREWRSYAGWGFAHYLDTLPAGIVRQAQAIMPRYRLAYSKTTESRYWANHCEACGVLQGDFHLFCEPREAFLPLDHHDIDGHQAIRLEGPFEAGGSFNYSIAIAAEIPGVRGHRPKPPPRQAVDEIAVMRRPKPSSPLSFWRRALTWLRGLLPR